MGQMYAFHKSVIGHSHITRGIPCEDSSASYASEDGRFHIAMIADGHGQKKSFRSKVGSQAAVDVALECLKEFALATLRSPEAEDRFYQDILGNPRYRQMTIRQLTDTIIAKWSDRIGEDYSTNPPSEEELGEYAEYYSDGKNMSKIYGTTLIAALRLPKCMILIHQGDGRCDVFYANGTVDQPIPWDDRCEGNVTTSFCDEDVAQSIRHCIIDTEKTPVVACYVGSDGVEDAYRSQEGTHTFYRDLTCTLVEKYETDFDDYLEAMLPEFSAYGRFSATGSLDDVSVAGIVDVDVAREMVDQFRTEVHKYGLNEDLFWKEDALRSKTRGHGILTRRKDEAWTKFHQAEKDFHRMEAELASMRSKKSSLDEYIEQMQQRVQTDRTAFEDFKNALRECLNSDTEPLDDKLRAAFRIFKEGSPEILNEFIEKLRSGVTQGEGVLNRKIAERTDLERKIAEKEAAKAAAQVNLDELWKLGDQAQRTFDEYDAKFQSIARQIQELKEQIAALTQE